MGDDSIQRSPSLNVSKLEASEQQEKAMYAEASQIASEESFQDACSQSFNPFAADKDKQEKFKALNARKNDAKELSKALKESQASAKLEDAANKFEQRNPELQAKTLAKLFQYLNKNDSQQEVLKKIQEFYPDPSLADEAIEYLIENTEFELNETLKGAKEELEKKFGRQIVAGKNIAEQARAFSSQGLGSPTALRDLYRDITGDHREPKELFEQLFKSYPFDKLKTAIQFLLHSLGTDLKSKGPSIPTGELAMLFTETRTLQSILGVYRFFQSRMRLVNQNFGQAGKNVPSSLNFESLAQAFMKLISDRYPSSPKLVATAEELIKQRDLLAAIIIISQFRDAIRGVSPRIFKALKERDDLLEVILKCLEELEDEREDNNPEEEG
jgi:type III secretion protein W